MNLIVPQFDTVSLKEMKRVKLMNRTDTKFVTTEDVLQRLLWELADDYMAQEISGEITLPYSTRYYDTHDLEMYYKHLHGKKTRNKIRVRSYESNNVAFLEVKRKNNKGRTDKQRLDIAGLTKSEASDFITTMSGYNPANLIPVLGNSFNRITLVNREMTERITIDTSLKFTNLLTGNTKDMSGLVIIELKRDGRLDSEILKKLKKLRIKPSGFSKYCIGLSLTTPDIKYNNLKPRLRRIGKMLEDKAVKI